MCRWRGLFTLVWFCVAGCATVPPAVSPRAVVDRVVPEVRPEVIVRSIPSVAPAPLDLWGAIRGGLALTAVSHPRIDTEVAWFSARSRLFAALSPGLKLYFAYIVAEVERRDMPMEVALLPIVESTLDPYAISHRGAAGLWQLMPSTARHYGVAMDRWYDGRRDPIDSTRAALDHLEYLRNYFSSDWTLAMAAYNCGEGCIARARRKSTGSHAYWDLDLSTETSLFVPRILALARILKDPQRYGFRLPPVAREPAFVMAPLDAQVDIRRIADLTSLGSDALYRLNPGLERTATPPKGPHRLLVPASLAANFTDALRSYRYFVESTTQYVVRRGDSLGAIAHRHKTSVAAIRANNTLEGSLIRPGQKLAIRVSGLDTQASNPLIAAAANMRSYEVAHGDTLWSISRRFGTSIATLEGINGIDRRIALRVGQQLRVPAARIPVAMGASGTLWRCDPCEISESNVAFSVG